MSVSYSKDYKNCATCAFWGGPRTCDYSSTRVIVDRGSISGKCAIPSGGSKGFQKEASFKCRDWQKWPILK